ncbi:MAG: hypothetical protein IPJ88_11885 [Myxococcales bacterium]|nr:MAG: hypothetical protein IPJ88_11885 [Myxococcales bacterium]
MLVEVFAALNDWVERENQSFRRDGLPLYRPCKIRVFGQTALLESKIDLPLIATNDVDVYADYEHAVQMQFEKLLKQHGKVLDPVGHEGWMPKETQYQTVYQGTHIQGQIALADYVLLAKAIKAPQKNHQLIAAYLARGASDMFVELAKKYNVDLEGFVK